VTVRQERTGWRDQRISERHRKWGSACAAVDVDFLLVEHNFGKPAALVEYKSHWAEIPNLKHANYRALMEVADSAKIPFIVVFYWPKRWAFQVFPVNRTAKRYFNWGERLSEIEFVKRLYNLRNRVLNGSIEANLNSIYPPVNTSIDWEDKDNPFE